MHKIVVMEYEYHMFFHSYHYSRPTAIHITCYKEIFQIFNLLHNYNTLFSLYIVLKNLYNIHQTSLHICDSRDGLIKDVQDQSTFLFFIFVLCPPVTELQTNKQLND